MERDYCPDPGFTVIEVKKNMVKKIVKVSTIITAAKEIYDIEEEAWKVDEHGMWAETDIDYPVFSTADARELLKLEEKTGVGFMIASGELGVDLDDDTIIDFDVELRSHRDGKAGEPDNDEGGEE